MKDQKRSFTLTVSYRYLRGPKISDWQLCLKKCVCWVALLLNGGMLFSCFWDGQKVGVRNAFWWGVLAYAKPHDDPADGLFG